MPTELFANAAQTFLTGNGGSISPSASSFNVTSSVKFPIAATGVSQFRVLCEAEIMIVTNVASTTWNVTRGAEGSTATTHIDGVALTHVVTAGAVDTVESKLRTNLDTGTSTWDSGVSRVAIEYTSLWGIDSDGLAYFNDTGVAAGDEAALSVDGETGRFYLTKVDAT